MATKNRKYDRNRKRSPSMASYRAGQRDKVNAAKKQRRHVKQSTSGALPTAQTARNKRRKEKQDAWRAVNTKLAA
jgi:hypothetical protein